MAQPSQVGAVALVLQLDHPLMRHPLTVRQSESIRERVHHGDKTRDAK